MKIKVMSVLVSDQDHALKFYTDVLGFVKKRDIPLGEHKWLTVVSPEAPDEVELLLEPMGFEPARVYQKALFDAGIPLVSFNVDNLQQEFTRLKRLNVRFHIEPTSMGAVTLAVLDDTCGNYVQIVQV